MPKRQESTQIISWDSACTPLVGYIPQVSNAFTQPVPSWQASVGNWHVRREVPVACCLGGGALGFCSEPRISDTTVLTIHHHTKNITE